MNKQDLNAQISDLTSSLSRTVTACRLLSHELTLERQRNAKLAHSLWLIRSFPLVRLALRIHRHKD